MQLMYIYCMYVSGSILKLKKITLCKLVSNQRIERKNEFRHVIFLAWCESRMSNEKNLQIHVILKEKICYLNAFQMMI